MKITVKPLINFDTGRITMTTTFQHEMEKMCDTFTTKILETQEIQTRKALIALGWTPPDECKVQGIVLSVEEARMILESMSESDIDERSISKLLRSKLTSLTAAPRQGEETI